MKRFFKILVSAVLCLTVVASLFCFNTIAAGSSSVSFDKSNYTVGDTVTVTVSFSADENMYSLSSKINYNSSVLEFKSGGATGGAGLLNIVESPAATTYTCTITFKALVAGSASIQVADSSYGALGTNGSELKSISGFSKSATVNDVSLSGNADLSSMRLSCGTLSPKFSPSKTTYNVVVPNSDTECKIYVTTADSNSSVRVEGSANLKIGLNTRTVIVTAPNGTTKSYVINITRSEEEVVPPTSSSETTSGENPEEPTDTPIETTNPVIDGITYIVAEDISNIQLISGFTASKKEYNGTEVAVAVDNDNNYEIYYLLAEDGTYLLCTYNEEDKLFEKLKFLSFNNNTQILAEIPEDSELPEDYYLTNLTVDAVDFKCYALNDGTSADFYYIYCFVDGHYGFYRYDSRENTLQRYPELKAISADVEIENTDKATGTILSRFNSLTSNAKIIVIGLLIVIICAIALIVLLIVKIFNKGGDEELEEENIFDADDGFESVTISDDELETKIKDEVLETDTEE